MTAQELAPEHGRVGGRPAAERQLVIAQSQVLSAFQKVMESPAGPALSLGRTFKATEHDNAVHCADKRRDCDVVGDGLVISITDAALVPASGELRVHCSILWATVLGDGEHQLNGYQIDLFLVRDSDRWKIVRRSGALTM